MILCVIFVCIDLLLPFVIGFCLSIFFSFLYLLALVIIGGFLFSDWLLSFLSFFICGFSLNFYFISFLIIIFYFKNFIFFYFFLYFFSPFSSELCGGQGLCVLAGCQTCASAVGEPSSGHWSTRDLLGLHNIKW